MKHAVKLIFLICIALLILSSFGCGEKDQRVFYYENDGMTDGTVRYVRIPDNWHYYGDYPVIIGKLKNERAIIASDENGCVIKPKKDFFADMDWVSFVREDIVFSEVYDLNNRIVLRGDSHNEIALSEKAKEELFTLLNTMSQTNSDAAQIFHEPNTIRIIIQHAQIENLESMFDVSIVVSEQTVYLGSYLLRGDFAAIRTVDPDSELYRNVIELTDSASYRANNALRSILELFFDRCI